MGNPYLNLSLFIMLLSFFLILNGISDFEKNKSYPVLNSLNITFASKDTEDSVMPAAQAPEDNSSRSGETLDQVDALFRVHISSTQARQNRLGTEMHMRMDYDEFVQALSLSLREGLSGDRQGLVRTLISLLDAQANVPYIIEVVHNIGENPANLDNSSVRKAYEESKLPSLMTRLQKAGMPSHLITMGIGDGQSDTVDLFFRRYQPLTAGSFPEDNRRGDTL